MFKNMKTIIIMLLVVIMLLVEMPLISVAADVGKVKVTPSGIAYDSIEDEVDTFIMEREGGLAACSVAVLDGNKTIFKKDYGMMDMENGIEANEDTVYEWGSISKLLVWVSVMQLQEEGKLDFDRDIEEYLPEGFLTKKKYPEKITIMNLMNHNAGWQETTYDLEVENAKDIVPLEQALRESEPSQIFCPGEITAYSNWGTALAAFIVEEVSGTEYSQYVKENIFEPLEMNHTSIKADLSDNPWVQKQRDKLKSYSIMMDSEESFGTGISYFLLYPAGSATGTIEDLIKFTKMFTVKDEICPLFKDESTLKTMLSASSYYGEPNAISGLERIFHGLWSMEYGIQVKGHAGNTNGCSTNLLFDDKTGLVVVVMTNELGETAFCYGIPNLIFGQYGKTESALATTKEDINGIYQNMRTVQKGFDKFYSYIGNFFPIMKTEVEGIYKLPFGGGITSKVGDNIYLLDTGNGLQFIQYLYKNEENEVYLQQYTTDIKQVNQVYSWLHIVLLGVCILSIVIAMFTSLVLILIWLIRKLKGSKDVDRNKYENVVKWLQRANLFAIVTIGVLGYQYLIKPVLGGELIRRAVQWKCILNGVLSVVSVIFSIVLAIYWKQIKTHRKFYVFSAVLGLILSFNFWYWEWYNYIC